MPRFVIVLLTMVGILGGTNLYLSYRVYQGAAVLFPGIRFWLFPVVFILFAVITVLGFARSMLPIPADFAHVIGILYAYWLGFWVYLLMFTVAADILTLLFRLCRFPFVTAQNYRLFSLAAVLALTLATVGYGVVHARQVSHISYDIRLEDRADVSDLKIVLISDLHLGAVGSESRLDTIVDEINALEPDIVCIAGDFFDTDFTSIRNPDKAMESLRRIRTTHGIYACLGNHDAGSTAGDMEAFLESCSIRVLKDEAVTVDGRLILVGRLDGSPIGGFRGKSRKELSEFFTRPDNDLPVIVMDHNPANVDTYADEADLILCGHTHKGQIFPGSLFTDRLFSVDYGYYRKDASSPHVVVTSGVGYWGLPMRVGTDCEIVSIRLTSE